jgi:hypothetical protein
MSIIPTLDGITIEVGLGETTQAYNFMKSWQALVRELRDTIPKGAATVDTEGMTHGNGDRQ